MEVGVEPQSGSILRDRIRQTAGHRRQGQSQVVVKVGAIAFEAHRRLELGHRFRFPSGKAHERHPQIVVEVGAAGIACQVCTEKRFLVAIYAAVLPGRGPEGSQQKSGKGDGGNLTWQNPPRQNCQPGGGRNDNTQGGQVLEVIGHPGVTKRVHIQETERRKEGTGENQKAGQRSAIFPREQNQNRQQRHKSRREEILPPHGGIDLPAGIKEHQVRRPKHLPGVEPRHAARQQETLRQGERVRRSLGADESRGPFHPRREKPRWDSYGEPGHQRQHVAPPLDPAALPPEDHQQHGR